jgi:hypothetical protein
MSEHTIDRPLVIRWVKRLQDPKSKQARKVLRDDRGGMCCLGHLCHVAAPSQWRCLGNDWMWQGEVGTPPKSLMQRVGLGWSGKKPDGSEWADFQAVELTVANDESKVTLPQIADALIAHYGLTPDELA